MAWIFQGNPTIYDIDKYLAYFPELIYWNTPHSRNKIAVGDSAFVWRSGRDAGIVGYGEVVEIPVPAEEVSQPAALGEEFWKSGPSAHRVYKTGIHLLDIRLTEKEGMLSRSTLASDPLLKEMSIIRNPRGTIFSLTNEQLSALEHAWGTANTLLASHSSSDTEGKRYHSHPIGN